MQLQHMARSALHYHLQVIHAPPKNCSKLQSFHAVSLWPRTDARKNL